MDKIQNKDIIKFLKDFLNYSPATIIVALVGFFTIPLLTKIFNPVEYGNYVLTISIVGVLSTIIESLWGNSLTRFFNFYMNKGKLQEFYVTLNMATLGSIVFITICFFISLLVFNMNNDLYQLMIYGIVLFIILSFFNVLKRLLIVQEKSKIYSILITFQTLFGFFLGYLFITFLKYGINGFIIGTIISYFIFLPIIYYICFKKIYFKKEGFSSEIFNKLAIFGFPMIISNLSAWILSLSDRYILNYYKGSFEVGIYSASYSLSEQSIVIIWNLFMTASYPLIVKIWENKGEKPTQEYISKLTRYYLLLTIPMVLGISILSKDILIVFTSLSYYESYKIVPIVLWGAMLLGLQWWAQLSLLLHNKTSKITLAIVFAAFLNISLNMIIVPAYGYVGAAISTLIAYFALFCMITLLSNNYMVWKFPFKSFFNIIIASILMVIGIFVVQLVIGQVIKISILNLFFELIIGIIVYIVSLVIINELTISEKENIQSIITKLTFILR